MGIPDRYHCSICYKAFANSSNRKKHVQVCEERVSSGKPIQMFPTPTYPLPPSTDAPDAPPPARRSGRGAAPPTMHSPVESDDQVTSIEDSRLDSGSPATDERLESEADSACEANEVPSTEDSGAGRAALDVSASTEITLPPRTRMIQVRSLGTQTSS